MKNINSKYEKIHDLSFENREILKKSKKCVCLYCNEEFIYEDIEDWIEDKHGDTAQCPFCDIDSVVPNPTPDNYTITEEDLQELYNIYF